MARRERERLTLPPSVAGIIRFSEEETQLKLKPEHVIMGTVALIVLEILLHLMF